jgi:ribosome-associated heat shock protein Hsp15
VRVRDKKKKKKLPVVYTYEIVQLVDKRQPASLVKNYIADTTPQDELEKAETARMAAFVQRDRGAGRPTKKERRDIERPTSR